MGIARVLILEDLAETRAWLAQIVATAFAGCTVTEASSVAEGLAAARAGGHDLALVDLGLPDGSGLDVVRMLRRHDPGALVVVATVMGDDASIIAAISAGAHGYLLKDSPADLFVAQLTQLQGGYPALSPSVARLIMQHFASTAFVPDGDAALLTPRESEVLTLVARGLRNAEVAEHLGLTAHTVAGYIKTVYAKLGISNRAEAARRAARLGLTDI
jgi:DNA-binding NarL/FixJ family response regulator